MTAAADLGITAGQAGEDSAAAAAADGATAESASAEGTEDGTKAGGLGIAGGEGNAAGESASQSAGDGDDAGNAGEDASGDGKGEGADEGEQGFLGAPKDGYGDFNIPEGAAVDQGMLDLATARFASMDLSQEGAQQIVDLFAEAMVHVDASVEQQRTALMEKWDSAIRADAEFGGDKLDQSQVWVTEAVQTLFKGDPHDTVAWLKESGVEYHPGLRAAFARIGRLLSDDTADGGNRGNDHARDGELSLADRWYGEDGPKK